MSRLAIYAYVIYGAGLKLQYNVTVRVFPLGTVYTRRLSICKVCATRVLELL
jgi:hypothetical protein